MMLVLVIAVSACGLYAGTLLFRRARILPAGLPHWSTADITVVIPARNEERSLGPLLESLLASGSQPAEVIVVDDDSEDATAEVARRCGATVLPAPLRPEDWKGKPWACWQGAQHATTPLLLFVDADVRFHPDALARMRTAVGAPSQPRALSVLPHHVTCEPYEELSLFFNVLLATGAGGFSAGDTAHNLFGHTLLIQRELYLRAGGHGAVRDYVLENLHLAAKLRALGGRVDAVLGTGALTMRMFPDGARALLASWTKGFASGASVTSRRTLLFCIAWLSGAATPVVALLLGTNEIRIAAAVLYLVYVLQILRLARKVGTYRWWAAAAYPLALFFYFALFARSAGRKKAVLWKGRPV